MRMHSVVAGLAAVVVIGAGGPAFAGARLQSATPAPGAAVAVVPKQLDLVFSQGVIVSFTDVTVIGPDMAMASAGDIKHGPAGTAEILVPLPSRLAAGTYTVKWRARAIDGRDTEGSYTFTVKP